MYGDKTSTNNVSTNNAISKIIQEIQSTFEALELKFVNPIAGGDMIEVGNETNHVHNNGSSHVKEGKFPKVGGRVGSRCFIESITGAVNCTDVIYDDGKTWYRSKSQIDTLIKVLKKKITHLKDIKKQLREESKQQQQKYIGARHNQQVIGNRSKGRRRGSPIDVYQLPIENRQNITKKDRNFSDVAMNKPKNDRNFNESNIY